MSPYTVPPDFFASIETTGPLEAAILLKRNGQSLAAWTKRSIPLEVITVMAATMLGSLETLVETLGESTPESLSITTGKTRIFLQKLEPAAALVLVAHASVSETQLRDTARRLVSRLPPPAPSNRPQNRVLNR
ncbi:MAG TPA: roadblock/LC7 domain-containing protein [Thermoplasmata archaeon]|nr:roadblock/LC7 domain-containing protein [Thermoplasmata archaeon]